MKTFVFLLFTLLLFNVDFLKGKEFYSDKRIKIQIVSANEEISKGDTNLFAIKITLARGWHIYWLNPGDAGEAPVFEISTNLSDAIVSAPMHPIPTYRNTNGIVTLEHSGTVYFPFSIYVPKDFPGNNLEIRLYAKWLVCKEKCIPGEAKLKKNFPFYQKIRLKDFEPKIKSIYQSLLLDTLAVKFEFYDNYAILQLNLPTKEAVNKVYFYPLTEGLFDLENNPKFSIENNQLSVELPLLQYIWGEKDRVEGILELNLIDKTKKYFWVKFVNTK